MIICSVCGKENNPFAVICEKCGGYLQNKVPNLDLFATIWQLIETPHKAFSKIILAEHKNYTFLLYALLGVFIAFVGMWHYQQGDKFENLLSLITSTFVGGILLGLLFYFLIPIIYWLLVKIFRRKITFRNSLSITAYSFFPYILAIIILFPLQLAIFGMYLFTFNPHPIKIKPDLYITFNVIYSLLILWSVILLIIGTKISLQINMWKAILIIFILYAIILTGTELIVKLIII